MAYTFFDRPIPLECNRGIIERQQEIFEKEIGHSTEAQKFQASYREDLEKADHKGKPEWESACRRYAGQIIDKQIDLMLYADSILTALFEIVPVEGNNIPSYSLWTTPEIHITRMSAHGNPAASVKYVSAAQYFPSLYLISTDRIYQPRKSILTGELGPNDAINERARYEIEQKIEDDLWTLIAAAVGTFTAASTWVYDSRIQNVPTTNQFDFSSEGGLTVGLFRSIMEKIDLVPARNRPNEPVSIRNIFIPHVAAKDIRTWVSVVSNVASGATGSSNDNQTVVTQDLHRQIEQRGPMIDSMWGEAMGIRKVNRLMGTSAANFAKYLWVFTDQPIGRLYVRPEEDRTDVLTDNYPYETGFIMSRMIGMEIPDPYKPNFMQVQFDS